MFNVFSKSTMLSGQGIGICPFRPVCEAHGMSQFLGEPSGLSLRIWLEGSGSRSVPWPSPPHLCLLFSSAVSVGSRNLCPGLPLNLGLKQHLVHIGTLRSYSKKENSFSPNTEEWSLIFLFNFFSHVILQTTGSQRRSSVIFVGGLGAQML